MMAEHKKNHGILRLETMYEHDWLIVFVCVHTIDFNNSYLQYNL